MANKVLILLALLLSILGAYLWMEYPHEKLAPKESISVLVSSEKAEKVPEKPRGEVTNFTGTIVEAGLPTKREKVIPIGFDANWIIRINVTDVNKENSAIIKGEEAVFLVHSPVLLLGVSADEAVGKTYDFCFTRTYDDKGRITGKYLERRNFNPIEASIEREIKKLGAEDLKTREKTQEQFIKFLKHDKSILSIIDKYKNDPNPEISKRVKTIIEEGFKKDKE